MIRILFAAALFAISCQAAAAGLPPKVEIKYKVSMGSVKIGEGTDVFEHDGKTYKVVSESKTAGLAAVFYRLDLRREATGTITPKGLRPDDYRETRNGQLRRSAHFDWQKKQADLQDGDRSRPFRCPTIPGTTPASATTSPSANPTPGIWTCTLRMGAACSLIATPWLARKNSTPN
jgi:hypothetical protein